MPADSDPTFADHCELSMSASPIFSSAALARATQRGEVCALVDVSDAFDPASAAAAGIEMSRLLWVRCGEKYPWRKNRAVARRGSPADGSNQGMPSGIPQTAENGHGFSRW